MNKETCRVLVENELSKRDRGLLERFNLIEKACGMWADEVRKPLGERDYGSFSDVVDSLIMAALGDQVTREPRPQEPPYVEREKSGEITVYRADGKVERID